MLSLTVENRSEKPTLLRKKDLLPGVIYGKDVGNLLIKLPYKDFEKIYKIAGESVVIDLKYKSEKGKAQEFPVLIREIQKDPLTERFIHVDFYQLPMNEEVEVTVPLEFEGEAPAETQLGGVLIKNLHEVEIKALPKNLISSIKVDVSSLKTFEDEIKIKDLSVPEGIQVLANPEEIVALVGKVEEEKIETAPVEEAEKPEEPEVIRKERKEEEEEGEEE